MRLRERSVADLNGTSGGTTTITGGLIGSDGQPLIATQPQPYTNQSWQQPAIPQNAAPAPAATQPPVAHDIQAAEEGAQQGQVVVDGDKVRFLDRYFRISESVGLMPLLRFAHSARHGVDATDPKGLIALYDMIADCVDQTRPQKVIVHPVTKQPVIDQETGRPKTEDDGESEWDRFQDYATEMKADDEDLMEFVGQVIEVLSARPKRRRGSSSAGPDTTLPNSKESSPSQVSGPRVPEGIEGLVPVDELVRRPS
jgi:hypothetical protein